MKKTLLLTVAAIIAALSLVSCASTKEDETAEEAPAPVSAARAAALEENGAIDLSTYSALDSWAMKYDEEAYTLYMNGGEYFQFALPEPVDAGATLTVHVTGTNEGTSGFRCWTTDNNQTTNADVYMGCAFDALPQGDFDVTFTLTIKGPSENLFFKGPQWGTMIEKLTLKSVAVLYN